MRKDYLEPELELIRMARMDIITSSIPEDEEPVNPDELPGEEL